MGLDLPVLEPEEMSRDELIVVVRRQAGQISAQAVQIAELMEANEALADRLARVEHLLSRNSGNSSNPPSKDDDPGKPAPPDKQRGRGGPQRSRGKQPGAPGTHLAWTDDPDERRDRFPEGCCGCGDDLVATRDLGVVTATSSTRFRRSPWRSPSTTSIRCSAVAGDSTPLPVPTGPDPGRSGTDPTWPRS